MESSEPDDIERHFKAFERGLDRELWVVTASNGTQKGGLIATFVNQASIVASLPRYLVGISKRHETWQIIEASGAFALHLIGPEHLDWIERFGLSSSRAVDKFAGLSIETGRSGSPILTSAAGWLDCKVEARFDTGDRTIYLAEVVEAHAATVEPVTVQSMIRLLPAQTLAQLAEDRQRDAAEDAAAIRAWRRRADQ